MYYFIYCYLLCVSIRKAISLYCNLINKVFGIKNTKFIVTTLIMKQVQKQVNCCVLTIFKTPMYGCKLMTIAG